MKLCTAELLVKVAPLLLLKRSKTFTDSEGAHLREDRFVCFFEIPSGELLKNAEK